MKILVLGGAGYIGSHTVYELIDAGEDVVIIDNLETGHKEAVHPKAKFYQGDLRDKDFVCIDSVKDLLIVYCTLLKLYVDRPYSSGHYDLRITPIYTPDTALLNIKTDSVLVICWHTPEELAMVDNIRKQREQMQQENIRNKPKLHYKTLAFQY